VYPNYLMNRFARYSLTLIALYMLLRIIISLFFYDQFPIAFLASEFNQDQMDEYRARIIIPAFFLTCIYFTGRYLSGKSSTSTAWPLYIVSVPAFLSRSNYNVSSDFACFFCNKKSAQSKKKRNFLGAI
jgi:hypothetical protein